MNTATLRLALRVEGDHWNAYAAEVHTMKGAVLLGSLAMRIAAHNPDIKAAFQALMQQSLADVMAAIGAPVSHWNSPTLAPPHEKEPRA